MKKEFEEHRQRKFVFQIGYGRCGTHSLCALFTRSGYKGVHFVGGFGYVYGRIMEAIRNNEPPVYRFNDDVVFFSDMKVPKHGRHNGEGRGEFWHFNRDFGLLERWYPNAKFILNVRPLEKWVNSKLGLSRGFKPEIRIPELAKRVGITNHDQYVKGLRLEFNQHVQKVRSYFQAAGEHKLIEFDIENDNPQKLIDFFAPDFKLKKEEWKNYNKTKPFRKPLV